MNRSILIVICDFLLVSLLAFSTVDINKTAEEGVPGRVPTSIATNQITSGQDLAAVMRLALEEERTNRDLLMGELSRARATAGSTAQEVQTLREQMQTREQESRRMGEQNTNLLRQFAAAQTNLQTLSQQLAQSTNQAAQSRERLTTMESELRKQSEEALALQRQLEQLAQSNQMVLKERERLASALEIAEVERRHAAERAASAQEQIKTERAERAKLAEGISSLAEHSGELTREIRENRPLAPNAIFSDYATNRVQVSLTASRTGFFGNESSKRSSTQTVLVSSGTNIYAVCHVSDTPLTFWIPGTDWENLSGDVSRNLAEAQMSSLFFHLSDPRIVMVPVSEADARKLGGKVYRTSTEPYKFQDAVVVGAAGEYYGEVKFEIDPSTPAHVRMDRNLLKGLFGKFNPSRGDLVFSKSGELMGFMVNGTYCLMLNNFEATAMFRVGENSKGQNTGEVLSRLYNTVMALPMKLQ